MAEPTRGLLDTSAVIDLDLLDTGLHGRQPRRRVADLMIAATTLAEGAVLLTRNPDDFAGLETLLEVRAV